MIKNNSLERHPLALVADLRDKVYEATGLPPRYQKMIGPRKLNIDDSTLETKTLTDLGIQDRTSLMLLHSPMYQKEKDAYEQLKVIEKELVGLGDSIRSRTTEAKKPGFAAEMATRVCCRLDAVDVAGSTELRAERKELIRRAEGLEGVAVEAEAAALEDASC